MDSNHSQVPIPPGSDEHDLRFLLFSMSPDERILCRQVLTSILPQHQRDCSERGVRSVHVDPQAGIAMGVPCTADVVGRTLDELEHGAFFIGIVGARYGPGMDADSAGMQELRRRSPWLDHAVQQGYSAGDIVIREGVWRKPMRMKERAVFFLQRSSTSPGEGGKQMRRLAALRKALRTSGFPVFEFDIADDLCPLVAACLEQWRDRCAPFSELGMRVARERMEHVRHRNSYCPFYLQRPNTIGRLNEFVNAEQGGVFWVIAESETDKTSLLVNWIRKYCELPPEALLIEHYVGLTHFSRSPTGFMHRVLMELKHHFSIAEEVFPRAHEIREVYNRWLSSERNKPVVIVIDGIDEFEGASLVRDILPPVIGSRVYIIASARQMPAMLPQYDTATSLLVPGLTVQEKLELINHDISARHSTSIPRWLAQRIANVPAARQPFHNQLVGRVLTMPDMSREEIVSMLEQYERCANSDMLVDQILRDLSARCIGLPVSGFLTALWGAQSGFAPDELASICGTRKAPAVQETTRLLAAFEPCLEMWDGLYRLVDSSIKNAVERQYLKGEQARRGLHSLLAGLLATGERRSQQMYELLHHLDEAGDERGLFVQLTRLDTLCRFQQDGREYQLLLYWSRRSGEELERRYLACLERHSHQREVANDQAAHASVGAFLLTAGRLHAAMVVLERERDLLRSRRKPASTAYALCLARLGEAATALGDYRTAKRYLRLALDVRKRLGLDDSIEHAEIYLRFAAILDAQRRYTDALAQLDIAEGILRKHLSSHDERCIRIMADRGALLYRLERDEAAVDILETTLKMCEKALGENTVLTLETLNSLGAVYDRQGLLPAARERRERARAISEHLFPPGHQEITPRMINLGIQCRREKDYSGAEKLYREALAFDEVTFGPKHPRIAGLLINLAMALRLQEDAPKVREALGCLRRARRIRKGLRDTPLIEISDVDLALASLLKLMGGLCESLKYYRLGLPARVVHLGLRHPRTREAFGGLVDLMVKLGRSYVVDSPQGSRRHTCGRADRAFVFARGSVLARAVRHAENGEFSKARSLCRERITSLARKGDPVASELMDALELLAATMKPSRK